MTINVEKLVPKLQGITREEAMGLIRTALAEVWEEAERVGNKNQKDFESYRSGIMAPGEFTRRFESRRNPYKQPKGENR